MPCSHPGPAPACRTLWNPLPTAGLVCLLLRSLGKFGIWGLLCTQPATEQSLVPCPCGQPSCFMTTLGEQDPACPPTSRSRCGPTELWPCPEHAGCLQTSISVGAHHPPAWRCAYHPRSSAAWTPRRTGHSSAPSRTSADRHNRCALQADRRLAVRDLTTRPRGGGSLSRAGSAMGWGSGQSRARSVPHRWRP